MAANDFVPTPLTDDTLAFTSFLLTEVFEDVARLAEAPFDTIELNLRVQAANMFYYFTLYDLIMSSGSISSLILKGRS